MSPRLSLIQLNIEQNKHLERVVAFLASEKPDVACIQEVLQSDIPLLERTLGAQCIYAPMNRRMVDGVSRVEGTGIFSRLPMTNTQIEYYAGTGNLDTDIDLTDVTTIRKTMSHVLVSCDVEKEGEIFRIAATHFTWTPDGETNEFQRKDLASLLQVLDARGEFVMCGDFNAPRGGEIFSKLAEQFTDNIPQEYTSSLDATLHRAGQLDLMVDGIFSTKNYRVSDVKRVSGVSDHCAFTAAVEKI